VEDKNDSREKRRNDKQTDGKRKKMERGEGQEQRKEWRLEKKIPLPTLYSHEPPEEPTAAAPIFRIISSAIPIWFTTVVGSAGQIERA